MTSPELPTPAEEKQISELIETNIDLAIERDNIHEVLVTDEAEEGDNV